MSQSNIPISMFMVGVQGVAGPSLSTSGIATIPAFAQSPVNIGFTGQFVPIDCRTGAVVVNLPPNPVDGFVVGISDVYNASAAAAPAGPIIIVAGAGGALVADPSNRGQFAGTVHLSDPNGKTIWWLYVAGPALAINKWMAIWW